MRVQRLIRLIIILPSLLALGGCLLPLPLAVALKARYLLPDPDEALCKQESLSVQEMLDRAKSSPNARPDMDVCKALVQKDAKAEDDDA